MYFCLDIIIMLAYIPHYVNTEYMVTTCCMRAGQGITNGTRPFTYWERSFTDNIF